MVNYTCEFSKIKDGGSTKYVQVPNENTAKRDKLAFVGDFNHTPLRNLDKYKIICKTTGRDDDTIGEIPVNVTYAREFKSDIKNAEDIYCAFKQEDEDDNNFIYIKHDDLTSKEKEEEAGAYDVYIQDEDDNGNPTFTQDTTTTYTFLWL